MLCLLYIIDNITPYIMDTDAYKCLYCTRSIRTINTYLSTINYFSFTLFVHCNVQHTWLVYWLLRRILEVTIHRHIDLYSYDQIPSMVNHKSSFQYDFYPSKIDFKAKINYICIKNQCLVFLTSDVVMWMFFFPF